ncbi:phage tail tape measure protein [Clostridium haemolyticum]|uniref:Phage tail tape measure protein domain-containing protein n=2 Tax=Clostridium TaxID=1485 RepID=A0ABR4THV1_CLOHA|nr:phage tail tape measure protein [Clostridium haemolyticum]KEI18201.1 hypothetical protein Z960_03450 [Clostridium haemolyticum NCTC 9693]
MFIAHVIDAILQLRDQFSGQLRHVTQNLSNFQRQTRYVSQDIKKVSKSTEKLGSTLTKSLTVPLVGLGTLAVKSSVEFGDKMAKVSTIADTTKVSMDNLQKGILELSNQTGLSATELAEAEYQALSASVDTAKVTEFLGVATKAAKGGFTDTATSVNGLTNVLNAYGYEADKANKIANQMLITQNLGKTTFGELAKSMGKVTPIASALKMKTEELFSSMAVTTAQGLDTAESVTGLKAALSNIIKPSKEAADAADILGIKFKSSEIHTKGWMPFLKDLADKLRKTSPALDQMSKNYSKNSSEMFKLEQQGKKNTEMYKNLKKSNKGLLKDMELLAKTGDSDVSAMATMFGSVEGLNTILMLTSDTGMKKYNESMEQMKNNTTALQDAVDKMETPGEKFRKALNKMHNVLISLGAALTPTLENITSCISSLANKLNNLTPAQQKIIANVGKWLVIIGPILLGVSKIGKSISNTITSINKLTNTIRNAGGVLAWLSSPGHLVVLSLLAIAVVAAVLITHWKQICEFTNKVKKAFVNLKNNALDKVKKAFEEVKKKIKQFKESLKKAEPTIKKVAKVLGVIFGPALIKTGTHAVIAGAKITGHFIVAIIKTGAQAVISGVKLTASFIGAIIKTGIQATISGAKLTATFIVAIIKTGAQAAKTAAIITGKLIIAIISYAAAGWKTVAAITAQTIAWLFQKAIVAAHTIVLIAHKVASIALTGVTKALTVAQWALNAAFSASPIGWLIIGIGLLVAAVIGLYTAWKENWGGIQEKTKAVIDKIREWWNNLQEFLKHPITGTVNLVKKGAEWVGDKISGKNALGTSYWGGGFSVVGEHGPEIVQMPKGSKVFDNKDTNKLIGNNGNITITFGDVHVREESDIDKIANALVRKIKIAQLNMT